jgi:8-oxo-dGTP pyrophosphatase MutT (NUDIX family)
MFNGQVLVMAGHELRDSVLAGNVLRTDFASFLYWKDRGLPDEAGVRNVFGCAVVRSGDGHLLFGRMAAHTAGSGRVYPMAGTPDPEDVTDGKLDVEGSIIRELMEEAGLDAAQATRTPGYLLVEDGRMCSLNAVFTFDAPSRELKARMMQHIETQESSELDEIVVFRRAAFHVHHRMPGFARALVQHLLD